MRLRVASRRLSKVRAAFALPVFFSRRSRSERSRVNIDALRSVREGHAVSIRSAFFALILFVAPLAGAVDAQSGFVTVKGKHFELDGKHYFYAGANLWYGAYLGSPGKTGDRARLRKELDQLASQGVLNLRVLAISEASPLKRAVSPAVQQGLGQVDDTLWQGLDFLLDEMAKRDMKAVLYLNNFWQWSGGMGVYLHWTQHKPVLDPDASGDWDGFMENSAA